MGVGEGKDGREHGPASQRPGKHGAERPRVSRTTEKQQHGQLWSLTPIASSVVSRICVLTFLHTELTERIGLTEGL